MNKPKPSLPKRLLANPKLQLVLFIFTIIYILCPVDFIPDVPPVGWMDDISILITELLSFVLYLKEKRRSFHKSVGQDNGS